MIFSLLTESGAGTGGGTNTSTIVMYVLIGVIIVAFIAWMFFSGRKNKQRQQEYIEQLDAIRPGHKVKTAGGICGVVVEVCDDNTVIIETGSENSGKSFIKMDKELIAQTDAKGPTQIAREEAEAQRKAEKEAKEAEKRGEAHIETPESLEKPAGADPFEPASEQPEQAAPAEEEKTE